MWNDVEDDDYYYADDVAEYYDQSYDDQYYHGAEYTEEEIPVYYEGDEEVNDRPDDAAQYLEQEEYSGGNAEYLEDAGHFYDGAGSADVETEYYEGGEEGEDCTYAAAQYLEQEEFSGDEAGYLEDGQFYDGAEYADVEYYEGEAQYLEENGEYADDYGYVEEEEVLEYLPVAVPLKSQTTQVAHVPKNWSMPKAKTKTPKHEFKLIPLRSTDEDYLYVREKMQQSIMTHTYMQFAKYEIIKIEKVWNTKVYSRFNQHVRHIREETDNELNEKELFHGSPKCHEIVKRGFDERHASKNGMYGAGVYFAKHSSKSNQYAFGLNAGCGPHDDIGCLQCTRQMMLCRVVLGNVYKCTSAQKFAHAPPGHHSVKGTTSAGNLNYPEYIVYRGEQAFPEFLITYKISV